MTSVSFERLYREAVSALREFHEVGEPYVSGGRRYCLIDGVESDDHDTLALHFGAEAAACMVMHVENEDPILQRRIAIAAECRSTIAG